MAMRNSNKETYIIKQLVVLVVMWEKQNIVE